jgi:hypothetical protein
MPLNKKNKNEKKKNIIQISNAFIVYHIYIELFIPLIKQRLIETDPLIINHNGILVSCEHLSFLIIPIVSAAIGRHIEIRMQIVNQPFNFQ